MFVLEISYILCYNKTKKGGEAIADKNGVSRLRKISI